MIAHPFLGNRTKFIQYAIIWVIFALLQTFALSRIVKIPTWVLLLDCFIHANLFGLIGILLWSAMKYGNYAALPYYQRYTNYVALAVLTLSIWLGISYGIMYLFFDDYFSQLLPLLPLQALIGVMMFLLIVFYYQTLLPKTEEDKSEMRGEMYLEDQTVRIKPLDPVFEPIERVAVKLGQKLHVVLVSDIFYLQADGDYVQIYTSDRKYMKEQTMKYFEENLPHQQFVRVHRSYIVNVSQISRLELYEKQTQMLTLNNGHQLKVSQAGYKSLKALLNL